MLECKIAYHRFENLNLINETISFWNYTSCLKNVYKYSDRYRNYLK